MAFVNDEDDGGLRSGFSGQIWGVLVAVAIGFAVKFLWPAITHSNDYTPDRIRAELEKDAGNRALLGAIRDGYPAEYQTFLRRMAETANATSDNRRLGEQAFNFTRGLIRIHFEGLAHAPSHVLRDIALQYAALYGALQRSDVRLCAQAATTGFGPGADVPPEARAIIGRIGAMQLAAARRGEAEPSPERGTMSEPESGRLLGSIRARSATAARLLQDEGAMAAAGPEQQCRTAVAVYEAVGALPPDEAATATVQLLRASLASAPSPG